MDHFVSTATDCVTVAQDLALLATRRAHSRRSKLDQHRAELIKLHAAGLTYSAMRLWLRQERRCLIAKSTLHHRLEQWLSDTAPVTPKVIRSLKVARATRRRSKLVEASIPTPQAPKHLKGLSGVSYREQSARILKKLCVFGTKKQRGRPGFSDNHIHSVSSYHTYVSTLTVAFAGMNKNRPFTKLREVTVRDIALWIQQREKRTLATSTLLRDRRVMRLLLIALGREKEIHDEIPRLASHPRRKGRLATALRYYTQGQWLLITRHQSDRNSLATEIAARCGLRAQGLITLMPPGMRQKSTKRVWRTDRFAGMHDIELWTIQEKNGLVREIAMPDDLSIRLMARAYPRPLKITDRGTNFETLFDVGGGRSWSDSFTQASKRALGWSAGGHGLRHSYADARVELLQSLDYSLDDSLKITSQELGHFRARVINAYLR